MIPRPFHRTRDIFFVIFVLLICIVSVIYLYLNYLQQEQSVEWITVDDVVLEQVDEFVYLGSAFSSDGRYTADVERRVSAGNSVNGALGKLIGSRNLSQKAQLAIHNTVPIPTLTYGSESWVWQREHMVVTEYKNRIDKLLTETQKAQQSDKERFKEIMESCVAMKQQASICQNQFEDLQSECKKVRDDYNRLLKELKKN